jgi:3-dehydroquinate synthase
MRDSSFFVLHSAFIVLHFLYTISMPDVPVNLHGNSYTVRIEYGLLARAGAEVRKLSTSSKTIIVTDQTVSPIHLPALTQSLRDAGFETIIATLPPGEQNKSLQCLPPIFDTILSARIERSTPLLALGGGIVGDMAGFVAATVLRGIPFVQIPTTLLAMVDASVGGKTGVNHAVGKNLIGAFHHPIAVLADPSLLETLPKREFIGGLAECIKHDIIRDADGFAALEQNLDDILNLNPAALTESGRAQCRRIKARVIEADPLENGERAHLNFGHTFAHAIERASDHAVPHGQAVALGMVAAANLATDLKMLDAGSKDRIIHLIARAGLPIGGLKIDAEHIATAMAFDKKVQSARIRFILPDQIGHVVIRDDIPAEFVLRAVESIVAE